VDAWRSLVDDVAERAVALGVAPDGQARTIATTSEIEPLAAGRLTDRDVVDAITSASRRWLFAPASAHPPRARDDPVTKDLLIQVAGTLEKQLWMIRAQRESA
jgi:starvation-inducible DNA-binding protein